MNRIIKIVVLAALAALATAAVASASVAVDASGNGFVGKGDVQNALGYKNDGAFQPDALSAKFNVNRTNVTMDVQCAHTDAAGNDIIRDIVVDLGYVAEDAVVTSSPKISGGKVTGYNLTGVTTTSGWTAHLDPQSKALSSCDTAAGEHFHAWGGTTPGRWIMTP